VSSEWDPIRDLPGVTLTLSRPLPGVVVVAIRGDLDLATHARVRACLEELRRDARLAHLVIDLTEVNFLQSVGIAVLADTQQSMPADQQLALLGVDDNHLVRNVLNLAGVLPRFTTLNTIDDLADAAGPATPPDPTEQIVP
jgi:anti-anti-sigma factor